MADLRQRLGGSSPAPAAAGAAPTRLFVAATIRARPSGLRRRFFLAAFAGAGVAVAAALAFRAAAQRFLCAGAAVRKAKAAGKPAIRKKATRAYAVRQQREKHSGEYRENGAGVDCKPLHEGSFKGHR